MIEMVEICRDDRDDIDDRDDRDDRDDYFYKSITFYNIVLLQGTECYKVPNVTL